jgi:2-iminoacetate synthase
VIAAGTYQTLFDATDFDAWRERSVQASSDDVRAAICGELQGLERFAALISPAAAEHLEEMAHRSRALTRQRFGPVMQMYAPVYLSNECIDTCTYCGFSRESSIHRITLNVERVEREAEILLEQGFSHLLLVSGEHPRIVSESYLCEIVRRLRSRFASVAIEVAPQSERGYVELVAAGVDSVTVYQETYDRQVYKRVHLAGRKKNFDWRLATAERAAMAGVKRVNIGALLGLAEWRRDALAVFQHASWMQKLLWRCQIAVSMPRIQGAVDAISALRPVKDAELVQYICALRICLPDVGLVLSTRERASLRDGIFGLGITHTSAGSHTEPGGYDEPDREAEQFDVSDDRSAEEVAASLRQQGIEVVWKDWEAALSGHGAP